MSAVHRCKTRFCGTMLTLYAVLVAAGHVLHAEEPVHFVSAGRLF